MVSEFKSQSAAIGANQGSIATWSQQIESFAAVPLPFQSACRSALADARPFPTVIYAPSINSVRRKTNERVIGAPDGTITIWERAGRQIVATSYRLDAISDLEVGQNLLYSWLTISGINDAGLAASALIEFNSVSRALYDPVINRIRPAARPGVATAAPFAGLDGLQQVNYKLANYARASLRAGEHVTGMLWQPAIRRPIVSLFGKTLWRTLSLAHVALLTDREVILIGDNNRTAKLHGGRYGGVWQYIALRQIAAAEVRHGADDLLTLALHLTLGGRQVDRLFTAEKSADLVRFKQQVEYAIGGG